MPLVRLQKERREKEKQAGGTDADAEQRAKAQKKVGSTPGGAMHCLELVLLPRTRPSAHPRS